MEEKQKKTPTFRITLKTESEVVSPHWLVHWYAAPEWGECTCYVCVCEMRGMKGASGIGCRQLYNCCPKRCWEEQNTWVEWQKMFANERWSTMHPKHLFTITSGMTKTKYSMTLNWVQMRILFSCAWSFQVLDKHSFTALSPLVQVCDIYKPIVRTRDPVGNINRCYLSQVFHGMFGFWFLILQLF